MNRKLRVRQAQTIVPFGVGSILETQGEAFVAADVTQWPQASCSPVESPRLARRLGVGRFLAPPTAKNDFFDNDRSAGVPYVRFPAWLFCGACRRMVRWGVFQEEPDKAPRCQACPRGPVLAPMRFVRICSRGHMDDVDWYWWAHSGPSTSEEPCRRGKGQLSFLVDEASTGLEALSVRCRGCGANRNLLNLLHSRSTPCSGRHPWQRHTRENTCQERAWVVPRNAGNLYYPVTFSALDIPAVEDPTPPVALEVMDRIHAQNHLWQAVLTSDGSTRDTLIDTLCQVSDVNREDALALMAHETGQTDSAPNDPKESPSPAVELSWDEWHALNGRTRINEKHLVTRPLSWMAETRRTDTQEHLSSRFTVTVVDRLREVRTLLGFSRVSPSSQSMVSAAGGPRPSWLPAVEVFGEGIFLSFDEERLSAWENDPGVRARVQDLSQDLDRAFQQDRLRGMTGERLLPRMPMLHTFAHLLIRQLAFESGYGIASLRERIYARPGDRGHQAGVLVYTSAGDTEGTLGGLAAQGSLIPLTETVLRLLETGSWCSTDPLCSEHGARGFGNLNRAACHACVLLPETSCETGNTLLDRVLLVGGAGVRGFFQPVVESALDRAARVALREE